MRTIKTKRDTCTAVCLMLEYPWAVLMEDCEPKCRRKYPSLWERIKGWMP